MAMTDVERQRKRREKIKNQLEEAKFEPKQFVAYAVKEMHSKGVISDQLLELIKKSAIDMIPKYLDNPNNINIMFISQKIKDFFENGE